MARVQNKINTAAKKTSPRYGRPSISTRTVMQPGASVFTRLQNAQGQDVRLGVDTDGGAWLSDPKVMDAILEKDVRTLTVYSSAYHKPPPPHKLSERTMINVTVSGWHPLPETLSRIRWAEQARANGWVVGLREVTADPRAFGERVANHYNRIHAALLKTDFHIMQQPLHKKVGGRTVYGDPQWGLPACCKGSKNNPQTCDDCEVAELLGHEIQEYWNIFEEPEKGETLLPDSPYKGRRLYQKKEN
jgi:hypothetical protein